MLWFEQTKTIVFDPPRTGTTARGRRYMQHVQLPDDPAIGMHDHPTQVMKHFDITNHVKIVCVRNPWRRVASMYKMKRGWSMNPGKATHAIEFEKFVMCRGHPYWSLDPYLELHDHVLQMEQWDQMTTFIDTHVPESMEPTTSTYQPREYFEHEFKPWYTQQMIDQIAGDNKRTIELLGYQFG